MNIFNNRTVFGRGKEIVSEMFECTQALDEDVFEDDTAEEAEDAPHVTGARDQIAAALLVHYPNAPSQTIPLYFGTLNGEPLHRDNVVVDMHTWCHVLRA